MRIGVLSDTHGSLKGWELAWKIFSDADAIIHCGDLFNHGPGNPLPDGYSPAKLLETFNGINKLFLVVRGNCDSEVDQKFLNIPMVSPFLVFQIGDMPRIVATHGHHLDDTRWLDICRRKWKTDILLSGHTHRWKIDKIEGMFWLNPGSPSLPAAEPSAAVIDTDSKELQVFDLDTLRVLKTEKFL